MAYAAMGLLCLNFSLNTYFFFKSTFHKPKFLRCKLINHANKIMKFNNAYLPLFFFCWALLYSPLAIWYAFEQNENLSTVNAKVTPHRKMDDGGNFDCFPFTYTSYRFTTGNNNEGCTFRDRNIPFVFFKTDQCGVLRIN